MFQISTNTAPSTTTSPYWNNSSNNNNNNNNCDQNHNMNNNHNLGNNTVTTATMLDLKRSLSSSALPISATLTSSSSSTLSQQHKQQQQHQQQHQQEKQFPQRLWDIKNSNQKTDFTTTDDTNDDIGLVRGIRELELRFQSDLEEHEKSWTHLNDNTDTL